MKRLIKLASPLLAVAVPLLAGAAQAGTATRTLFGTGADGVRVDAITLANKGGMRVTILTRGGAITDIQMPDRAGRFDNVTITQPDFAAWNRGGAFNTIVGRFANRIGGGGFNLDGTFYKLPANPETGVTIHGGRGGWSSKIWSASEFETATSSGVTMALTSPDGDNGFPGQVATTVRYTLGDDNVLRLDFSATTDKPTVVNLTNHLYFALGSGSVDGQMLELASSHYTPTDARQIPTGEIADVAGTPFDFREPRQIGAALRTAHPQMQLARGIDHNFVIDGSPGTLRLAARLHDPASGRRVEVRTTEPGMQIYTANGMNGTQLAAGGRALRQGDAIAFETQHYPDSPNKPEFPSTVLRPGETLRSTTEFRFSTDAGAK